MRVCVCVCVTKMCVKALCVTKFCVKGATGDVESCV